ncbi:hypothetical protein SAMN05661080_00702 [Modestobacter sp. DSM 44400]|uniref:hypothetical protein n=1 Tax=Modestobacter sp. DSM 44400 TaxID=1550230 RepID=UPI000895A89E|nr:hypothetical protein [Modestobacter sp. DSM 44400]SDX65601.1 hypothetical protein SAMN05661080_00702 [Modestobacter sp. DSM 44400]
MPQDRPTSRRLLLVLLTAVLVAAAVVAGLVLGQRDRTATAEPAPTAGTSASSAAPATNAAIDAPVDGALTFEALMTPADVADAGLTVADPVAIDAPLFPVLCDAPDWGNQWSAPEQGVGHEYPTTGAGVSEYAVGYADSAAASAALARLTDDAVACPTPSTGGSIEPTGTVNGTGDESAVFVVDDGGRDGVIRVTWSVVVRSGSTLLHVGYTTEQSIGTGSGPGDGGDDAAGDSAAARSTAESLAHAAVDRFNAQA